MNSSDDAYEGFRDFSLHHVLGGSKELDILHRRVWEGITRQFTRYGQIYREFDGNWDWMHHGEGYVSFYPLGMADPHDKVFRDRSIRFAAMYTGEDPEAPNYDSEQRLMRASMTGSRTAMVQPHLDAGLRYEDRSADPLLRTGGRRAQDDQRRNVVGVTGPQRD